MLPPCWPPCPACRCSVTARLKATGRNTAWSTAAPTGRRNLTAGLSDIMSNRYSLSCAAGTCSPMSKTSLFTISSPIRGSTKTSMPTATGPLARRTWWSTTTRHRRPGGESIKQPQRPRRRRKGLPAACRPAARSWAWIEPKPVSVVFVICRATSISSPGSSCPGVSNSSLRAMSTGSSVTSSSWMMVTAHGRRFSGNSMAAWSQTSIVSA